MLPAFVFWCLVAPNLQSEFQLVTPEVPWSYTVSKGRRRSKKNLKIVLKSSLSHTAHNSNYSYQRCEHFGNTKYF